MKLLLLLALAGCGKIIDTVAATDADNDGYGADVDCDDTNAAINPGAAEVCNGIDDNCDGVIDTDATDAPTWYPDADKDSAGSDTGAVQACEAPAGYADHGGDCDDTNPAIHPGAAEPDCTDPTDYNCDGKTAYADADGDGFAACKDCDDTNADVNPDATEVCDGIDNDCDGTIDGPTAVDATLFYADTDGDGYGDPTVAELACKTPAGYVSNSGDCDDTNPAVAAVCSAYPVFTGKTGSAWESKASTPASLYSLMVYKPAGIPYVYNMYGGNGYAYDPAKDSWSALPNALAVDEVWTSAAPIGTNLFIVRDGTVYDFDTVAETWSKDASVTGGDTANMTETDENGVVYGYGSSGDIVAYDTVSDTTTYYPTGMGGQSETRLAYDPGTRSIFFGGFSQAGLYKLDLGTGVVSTMTSIPESMLNDIFCSDRSGHIYAAGDSSGTTIWQYDVASDTWNAIPDLPTDEGDNGSCTIADDGWLYLGTGQDSYFYRLSLELK